MANFYCEYCGNKYNSVVTLTSLSCARHPEGRGKHKLYEGGEKPQYTCKFCGYQYRDLLTLTALSCPKHPGGSGKGKHSPAL